MAGSFDLLFSWKMMRAWKGEKKMKKIVPSAAAALVFVLITLLYYRIAAGINVEWYSDASRFEQGAQNQNYYCEVWIPVEKK